jgi:predicted transcriptional regulator
LRQDGDIESKEVRSRILEYISSHPGAYLREIKRAIGISMGTVQYHLYSLEKERKIISKRRGLYKRFFVSFTFTDKDQKILDVLSQETERDILLYLSVNPGASHHDISEYIGISPGTTSWHMKRLVEAGLETSKRSTEVVYFLQVDAKDVAKLLKVYHTNIWERWADRLAEIFNEIPGRGTEEEG